MYHQKFFNLKIVQTKDLDNFFELFKSAKKVFFDTETSGLYVRHEGADYVVGYTFAFEDSVSKDVFYVPVRHIFEGVYAENDRFKFLTASFLKNFPDFHKELFEGEYYNVDAYDFAQRLKEIMEKGGKEYIAHNITYDLHLLANEGIDIEKVFERNTFQDTQIMVHTIDESVEKNLESVTKRLFHVEKSHYSDTIKTVTKDEKLSQGLKATQNASFQHVQISIGGQYSAEDVWFMKQMFPMLLQGLIDDNSLEIYTKCRIPFMKVLWKMERKGVKVDIDALDKMQELAEKEAENLKYKMFELTGVEFNPDSSQHLYEILFGFKKKTVLLTAQAQLEYDTQSQGMTTAKKAQLKKSFMSNRNYVCFKESYNEPNIKVNFGFKPVDWTDGGTYEYEELKTPKTGGEVLKKLLKQNVSKSGHEFIELLVAYKKLSKLISAFMIGLRECIYSDGKVHCSFNICGTDSWRLSSQMPNMQQLPHPLEEPKEGEDRTYYDFWERFEIRKLFIAEEGYSFITADYTSLERYLTAHLSQDKVLCDILENNRDSHSTVAKIVFPELKDVPVENIKKEYPAKRQLAKKISFCLDYGGSAVAVARNLEIDQKTAQMYIDKYFEGFYGLHTYDQAVVKFAKTHGYVKTLGGHKRHLWDINSSDRKVSSYLERVAVNVLSQGSGADVTMFAQLDIDNDPVLKSIGAYMVMNIHDEVAMICPTEYKELCMERLKFHMENCMLKRGIHLTYNLKAVPGYGKSYFEAK